MGFFKSKANKRPRVAAIIAAAGMSSRMGGTDKLFAPLFGVPILAHTFLAFEHCDYIDEIIVAAASESIVPIGDLCKGYGITKATQILRGGESRTESVYAALMSAPPETEYAAIHDGARPLVKPALIAEVVECAFKYGAAVPATPLTDTVKSTDGGNIIKTVDRNALRAVQTPQVFQIGLIKGALTKAIRESAALTDDCAAVERIGMKVKIVAGSPGNIKITAPADLAIAEALMGY